ncbi:hypothetical protein RND81_04G076300 [Saponaria officinalis]|uniref:Transposase n=1 Tax=Saponaria officinalis TaxID=3572 RepID=A0AAW1LJZ1_SAPOF
MGKGHLTAQDKDGIVHFILANSNNGEPKNGVINEASAKWGLKIDSGVPIHLPSHKLGNTNKPKRIINKEMIIDLPKSKRGSMEKLSKQIGVGYGTIQRWVKKGSIRKHTNTLHQTLSEATKFQRLIFALGAISINMNNFKFNDMNNHVHIDEKWFYLTKTTERYYLLPEEEDHYRSCQSKRLITKVMFMCAVSRPILDDNGEVVFDGKIGIFPFVEMKAAKRRSKNRAAGVLVTKAVDSITKEVTKACLITKIIPAIKEKWPSGASKDIYIQQDNAKPHLKDNDLEFRAVADSDGFNIHLVFQPPNSPDLNINDLGFFRSIQSLQNEKPANNIEELVEAVENAFLEHVPTKLNDNFLTLQAVMIEIMKVKGHNNFKIPHMRKGVLQRQGILPRDLEIDGSLVRDCLTYLVEHGYETQVVTLMNMGLESLE